MPFLEACHRAWGDCPSLRRMKAAELGIKPKEKPTKNFHELAAMFPGGTIK
jgi:hypothetical protein